MDIKIKLFMFILFLSKYDKNRINNKLKLGK